MNCKFEPSEWRPELTVAQGVAQRPAEELRQQRLCASYPTAFAARTIVTMTAA
jgi:hypothetical protein